MWRVTRRRSPRIVEEPLDPLSMFPSEEQGDAPTSVSENDTSDTQVDIGTLVFAWRPLLAAAMLLMIATLVVWGRTSASELGDAAALPVQPAEAVTAPATAQSVPAGEQAPVIGQAASSSDAPGRGGANHETASVAPRRVVTKSSSAGESRRPRASDVRAGSKAASPAAQPNSTAPESDAVALAHRPDPSTAAAHLSASPRAADAEALDRTAIGSVLDIYRRSYSTLDVTAVSAVWRGVDTRGLQRAFEGLARQRLSFELCDVQLAAQTARALCTGTMEYVPKVGPRDPRRRAMSWTIDLQRADTRWLITRVDTR